MVCVNIDSFDPYDLWCTDLGVGIRRRYYEGKLLGKMGAVGVSLADWVAPQLFRTLLGSKKRPYPILSAQHWLRLACENGRIDCRIALEDLRAQKSDTAFVAWGLGFPWMSKNGLYGPKAPFVTHTPYVMEALLRLAEDEVCRVEAMELFHGTWGFLESLKVMHEGPDDLALSYAPVDEPRIVVNANSYAAFAYALHAVHGKEQVREEAAEKAIKLVRWVVRQQGRKGEWFYYADREPGNFIDCFHSCFVMKNLNKANKLLPQTAEIADGAIKGGWSYIRNRLYDPMHGLVRRFAVRSHHDPFRWDLYDQAEFLGLLVDFGELEWAREFTKRVENRFRKGDAWFCRIDVLGRRWGRNFLRWGIVPFWYHRARLEKALIENT